MKEGKFNKFNIKAIIFDIGGVLFLGGKPRLSQSQKHISGVHETIAKKLKINLDQYFDSIDTAYSKSMEGAISKQLLLKTISLNLNYPPEKLEKLFVSTYKKKFKKNKELFSIAKKLKKQKYKIAILSDQWHLSKEALVAKKDFDFFDKMVISCDVGIRKPNEQIYKLILKKLGLKPQEVLFIDNQSWNLIPANKLGMETILFVNNKKTKKQLSLLGIKLK